MHGSSIYFITNPLLQFLSIQCTMRPQADHECDLFWFYPIVFHCIQQDRENEMLGEGASVVIDQDEDRASGFLLSNCRKGGCR